MVVGGVVGLFLVLLLLTVYTHRGLYTYTTSPPRINLTTVIQDFCADAHGLTRKCWWWVVLYALGNNALAHQTRLILEHENNEITVGDVAVRTQ